MDTELINLISRYENKKKGFGMLVHFAKLFQIPKGLDWVTEVGKKLNEIGYCVVESSGLEGLPDEAAIWWPSSDAQYTIQKKRKWRVNNGF